MITKAALILFRDNQGQRELLFTRTRGRSYYVFPGGKQEPDEAIEQTLQRELQEELGTQATDIKKIGVVSGKTPDGRDMEMHLYGGDLLGDPQVQDDDTAEEIAWITQAQIEGRQAAMTPMTLEHVLPFLKAQGLW